MFYDHKSIENKWQKYWEDNQTYKSPQPPKGEYGSPDNTVVKSPLRGFGGNPKYYVLDMFPYPSGAGLHVGHPLGYIASDIMARFKRHQGFNVLHPIGYDSFGLPAEQYAIQTGQHPATTTEKNINRYEEQLRKIGFSFDWSREVRTSDPSYYKWTQWIFIELFHSWYNKAADKAEPISTLIEHFEKSGTENLNASETEKLNFTAEEWKNATEIDKQDILLNYRMAFRAETTVNWCPALGTVLANDEVKDGKSERGGYPVFQKKMMQWSMRISAYSERLLQGLKNIDWPQPLKDSQEYWIGKSVGAEIRFPLSPKGGDAANNVGESALLNSEGENTANTFGEILQEKNGRFGYLTGGNNSVLNLKNAQANRDNMTEAESILWELLMSKKMGFKFRRQHLIDDFIVDFVCLSKGLVIEVDGGYHNSSEQQISDAERTKILEEKGYKVIRFKNEEIIGNTDNAISKIKQILESQPDFKINSDEIQANSDIKTENSDENQSENQPHFAPLESQTDFKIENSNNGNSENQSANQPQLSPLGERGIEIFTTRPDTIFGATFMVLAPEHPLVEEITTVEQKSEVENYQQETSKKTERDRMADVKNVSGAFTGSYAVNPFTEKKIPIYISDYVLMGYGTGAVMAVPAHDERDHRFAKKFGLEIINVIKNDNDIQEESYDSKDSVCVNSGFLDGLNYNDAKAKIISEIEHKGIGHGTTNYRQRDAIFSRQRYWGEPVPVYYKDEMPYTLPISALPLELPEVEKYLPTEDGDPPLGNAKNFAWDEANQKVVSVDLIDNETIFPMELSTMPGWAGSSWYFLRYMDPKNEAFLTDKNLSDYWGQVDLYIGGSEHATGHLLYSRFWNMFLKDRGYIEQEEPFKKLINQGMILGMSAFVHRVNFHGLGMEGKYIDKPIFVSSNIVKKIRKISTEYKIHQIDVINSQTDIKIVILDKNCDEIKVNETDLALIKDFAQKINDFYGNSTSELEIDINFTDIHTDVSLLKGTTDELDTEAFKNWRPEFADAEFILEDGKYIVEREVEKMSKSKYNVVNPDDICDEYGADCLRLYEMFLGPLEQSKPWNTQGLSGVYGFLKKFYNLYYNGDSFEVSDEEPTKDELKVLHTLIKKVLYDLDHFSFNTSVSSFMIAVNELQKLKCNKRAILEPLAVMISPYAPHICEELWEKLGHAESIEFAPFPELNETYLIEDEIEYPVSFNGKMKFKIPFPAETSAQEIEDFVRRDEKVLQILEGNEPKKIIIVPKKIINIVL